MSIVDFDVAVTRKQLLERGALVGTIDSWLRRGRLTKVLPGVYASQPLDLLTKVHATLLWLPAGAVSHRTAAWLWQMASEPILVELTVPRRCSRRSPVPWLRLYRRDLPNDRLMRWGRFTVIEPEQTVLDCMAVLDEASGIRLIERALHGHAQLPLLRSRQLDNTGRRGAKVAASRLPQAVPGAASHPERVLARALARAGLTGFRVNRPVRGYVADLLHEQLRLIVEIDGWAFHGSREAFQRDRTRQNVLIAAGFTVLRYTAVDIEHRLPEVLVQIRDVVSTLRAKHDRRKSHRQ